MKKIIKYMLGDKIYSADEQCEEFSVGKQFFNFCSGLKKELEEKTIFVYQYRERVKYLNEGVCLFFSILKQNGADLKKLSSLFFDPDKFFLNPVKCKFGKKDFNYLNLFYDLYWKGIKIKKVKDELESLILEGAGNPELLSEYKKYVDSHSFRLISIYDLEECRKNGILRIKASREDFFKVFLKKNYGKKYEEKIKAVFYTSDKEIKERNELEKKLILEVIDFNTKVGEMRDM